jgi:hypothetical protein
MKTLLTYLFILFVSTTAQAQSSPYEQSTPPPAPSAATSTPNSGIVFDANVQQIKKTARDFTKTGEIAARIAPVVTSVAANLTKFALMILVFLMLLGCLKEAAQHFVSGQPINVVSIVAGNLVAPLIIGGLIVNWNMVVSATTELSGIFLGAVAGDFESVTDLFLTSVGGCFNAAANILSTIKFTMSIEVLSDSLIKVAGALIFVVIAIVLVWALANVLAVTLKGVFLVGVALAFGPVLVAFGASAYTRDYLGKWLGFTVSGCIVTSIALLLVQMFSAGIGILDFDPNQFQISAALVALLAAWVLKEIVSEATGISSALVPGGLGVSSSTPNLRNDIAGLRKEFAASRTPPKKP